MTNLTQADFNSAITFLQGSSLDELLSLFIEAKTGSYGNEDRLPIYYFGMVDEVGEMIYRLTQERDVNVQVVYH